MAKLWMTKGVTGKWAVNNGIICEIVGKYNGERLPGVNRSFVSRAVGCPLIESQTRPFLLFEVGGNPVPQGQTMLMPCEQKHLVPLNDDKEGDEDFVRQAQDKLKAEIAVKAANKESEKT